MGTQKIPLPVADAVPYATNYPELIIISGTNFPIMGLKFDATTQESVRWVLPAFNYATGNLTFDLWWYADTASSGNCVWETQISAITANTDTQDIETDGLATLNFVQDTHLGTTGQRLHHTQITISNLDSLADADLIHIKLARDADGTNATDDMAGDAILVQAALQWADA